MNGHGQFCPVAVACEVFAHRWTPLILRELFAGSTHFNEIRRGLPLISKSLLAQRLRALELDAENLQAQAEAERSAKSSLDLVRTQYNGGSTSYLQVLDATRQYQQTRIGLIEARAARLSDTAALYAALGGGWKHEAPAVAVTTPLTESR